MSLLPNCDILFIVIFGFRILLDVVLDAFNGEDSAISESIVCIDFIDAPQIILEVKSQPPLFL